MPRLPETRPGPAAGARGLALALGLTALACARGEEAWRAELDDPDPFVRGLAAIGLAHEAPRAAGAALPVLVQALERVDVGLEPAAARALAHVAPFHVPALLERLVADETLTLPSRRALQAALAAAGPAAAEPVVACLRGPGSQRAGVLGEVVLALGEPAVPHLVETLADEPDVRLRNYAAFLLAMLGPRARSALPALRVAAGAEDPDLRRMARAAIESLEGRPWQVPTPGEGPR